MKIRTAVMAAVCAFGLYSCSGDGEADGGAASGLPSVTVVTSVGGMGDMGYNDLILDGVMRFYDKGGVRMSLVQPTGMEQAGQALDAWVEETRGGGRSLLVLADDGYGELLRRRDVALATNQSILLFESGGDSLPAGVTTFSIDRYGAAWLAGSMCREHPSATVIAAMPGNSTLQRAIDGFTDGYTAGGGSAPEVLYLSDGEEGFAMADSAYRLASRLERTVILPLAGGSNGGLLVGACLTQRPDLYCATFPMVGVLDMLRYHRFTIGWAWASDYGTSDDSREMFEYLKSYSPLHNIANDGTEYPAVLVTTADHDDRVVPAHSFKYAAQLQWSDTGDAPKLIRIDTNAGHGGGKPVSKVMDEMADIYAFMMYNIGMSPKF